jgi:hypothetical protein
MVEKRLKISFFDNFIKGEKVWWGRFLWGIKGDAQKLVAEFLVVVEGLVGAVRELVI